MRICESQGSAGSVLGSSGATHRVEESGRGDGEDLINRGDDGGGENWLVDEPEALH